MMQDDLDQLVRDATARDVHVARLTTGVMARLPSQTETAWFAPGLAAFVAMLIATPVAILQYPVDTDGDYAGSVALGDTATLDADVAALFTEGAVE